MLIYPAIDIKGGRVVRMGGGADGAEIVYAEDPVAQAEALIAQGATWLHVVDVDRAYETGGDNTAVIERICRIPGSMVQMGGNLADVDHAQRGLDAGASRIVAGTAVLLDHALLDAFVRRVTPARLAVAVEIRHGYPWLRATRKMVSATPKELVRQVAATGIGTVVFRNLERDGQLSGADLRGAARLVGMGPAVIAAGGVASVDEVALAQREGLAGIIVGRALYERRLSLGEALACLG